MPNNSYKVGDKVWWVNNNFQPVLAIIKKVTEIGCLIHVEGDQTLYYIKFKNLFYDEKVAWDAASVQLTTQILQKHEELDALFELRDVLRKHLYQMPED